MSFQYCDVITGWPNRHICIFSGFWSTQSHRVFKISFYDEVRTVQTAYDKPKVIHGDLVDNWKVFLGLFWGTSRCFHIVQKVSHMCVLKPGYIQDLKLSTCLTARTSDFIEILIERRVQDEYLSWSRWRYWYSQFESRRYRTGCTSMMLCIWDFSLIL